VQTLISRRANWVAAALMLAALLASLALLARPAGNAGASTALSNVAVDVRYGCGDGKHGGDFVEVKLTPGAQVLDGSDPMIVQVGLATKPADDDLYPDGGPTLVSLRSGAVLVRLAGPVTQGQHLFVRDYGQTAYRNIGLPASCEQIDRTDFGLADPDIYGNHQVTCAANAASMNLTLTNNNDSPVDYTVLLVRKDGQLAGSQSQGIPVSLGAKAKQPVTVTQPPTTTKIFKYQVRVIAPDGQVTDVADVTMHCDSQPPGPTITPTPVRPSHSPSSKPSTSPSASHSTSSATQSRPRPSVTPSHSSAPAQPPSGGAGSSQPAGGGAGGGGPVTSASAGGPVLGDADSTSQPQRPTAVPTPTTSNKTIVEAGRVDTAFVNPGFTGAVVLVLLGFAGSTGVLLLANQASNRRR
jgi:hypothetical protein